MREALELIKQYPEQAFALAFGCVATLIVVIIGIVNIIDAIKEGFNKAIDMLEKEL